MECWAQSEALALIMDSKSGKDQLIVFLPLLVVLLQIALIQYHVSSIEPTHRSTTSTYIKITYNLNPQLATRNPVTRNPQLVTRNRIYCKIQNTMLLSIKEYIDRIEEYLEGVDEETFKQKLLISVDLLSRFLFTFLRYNMNPQPATRNPQPPTCNP